MKNPLPSGSSLHLGFKCANAFRQPHVLSEEVNEDAERGTAIHEFLEGAIPAVKQGQYLDALLRRVPDEHQAECVMLDVRSIINLFPADAEFRTEVPFKVLVGDDGRLYAKELTSGRKTGYHEVDQANEFALTVDLVVYSPSQRSLFIGDHKSGRHFQAPSENDQLAIAALAAFHTERRPVEKLSVGIFHITDGRIAPLLHAVDRPTEFLGDFEKRLLGLRSRIQSEIAQPFIEGEHCKFCPARLTCSAKASLVQNIGAQIDSTSGTNDFQVAYQLYRKAKEATDLLEGRVREHVRLNGPLDLGNGKQYGQSNAHYESLDAETVFNVLEEDEELGLEAAKLACRLTTTKKDLEKAILKSKAKNVKTKLAEVMESVLSMGGVHITTQKRFIERKTDESENDNG